MSTAAVSRTIDVSAFRTDTSAANQPLLMSIIDEDSGGETVTGIQKLAQRWIINMLTDAGTIKYNPTVGTFFISRLLQGYVRSDADMSALFTLSELRVRSQMRAEETADDPLDERYREAVLVAATVVPGYVYLTVELRSLDPDTSLTFIVPIPIIV